MNVLETIVEFKKSEISSRKSKVSIAELEKRNYFSRPVLPLKDFLVDRSRTGIIAEFKRRSPSKGIINATADVIEVTKGYTDSGASCLSVLTDEKFFGGSDADLVKARTNEIPILRKDFIVDEYQLIESRSLGADVILLIAACLTPKEVKQLAATARNLGLEVLLEIHGEEEMEHICEETAIVGINNRDLKTFDVDIERSLRMADRIPFPKFKVAESGISNVDDVLLFKRYGFQGFLIGENFMKATDPTIAFAEFVNQLKAKAHED
jgi:indole-3-glycerol phosphate synthase